MVMAIHLFLLVLSSESHVLVRGWRMSLCASVISRHLGPDKTASGADAVALGTWLAICLVTSLDCCEHAPNMSAVVRTHTPSDTALQREFLALRGGKLNSDSTNGIDSKARASLGELSSGTVQNPDRCRPRAVNHQPVTRYRPQPVRQPGVALV